MGSSQKHTDHDDISQNYSLLLLSVIFLSLEIIYEHLIDYRGARCWEERNKIPSNIILPHSEVSDNQSIKQSINVTTDR